VKKLLERGKGRPLSECCSRTMMEARKEKETRATSPFAQRLFKSRVERRHSSLSLAYSSPDRITNHVCDVRLVYISNRNSMRLCLTKATYSKPHDNTNRHGHRQDFKSLAQLYIRPTHGSGTRLKSIGIRSCTCGSASLPQLKNIGVWA